MSIGIRQPWLALAALCATLAALPLAAQTQNYKVGDAVDAKVGGGRWIPCTLASQYYAGGYDLHCSIGDIRSSGDADHMRPRQGGGAAATPPATAAPFPAPAGAQQFKIGDQVEINSAGAWKWCTVSSTLYGGGYDVQCGPSDLRTSPDAAHIRPHTLTAQEQAIVAETKNAMAHRPAGNGIGAQYGTRERATCNSRSGPINATTARQYFICDTEGESLGRAMILVTNVSVQVAASRAFNWNQDSAHNGIDPSQPVYDIRGSFQEYMCNKPIFADNAFAVTHNCSLYNEPQAQGTCYKTTFGEWHCDMADANGGNTPAARNVMPPAGN
jgi:hypothetical protein